MNIVIVHKENVLWTDPKTFKKCYYKIATYKEKKNEHMSHNNFHIYIKQCKWAV